MRREDREAPRDDAPRGKRPWRAPRLVEYGSVSSITRNTMMGSFADAMGRLMAMK